MLTFTDLGALLHEEVSATQGVHEAEVADSEVCIVSETLIITFIVYLLAMAARLLRMGAENDPSPHPFGSQFHGLGKVFQCKGRAKEKLPGIHGLKILMGMTQKSHCLPQILALVVVNAHQRATLSYHSLPREAP